MPVSGIITNTVEYNRINFNTEEIDMNNKYIITAAIKGSEDRLHRLSYDLVDQTEDSVKELTRFVKCLDERSTKVYDKFGSSGFCVQKYKFDKNSVPEVIDMRDPEQFDTLYNSIEPVKQNTVE